MKLFLMGLTFALLCCPCVYAQAWRDNQARLCFVRPENNGAMNVLESWIHVADYGVPVIGGQAVCLYLQAGDSELTVTSRHPYDPKAKDDEACRSKALKLSLSGTDNRTFLVCPASKGNAYACGWRVTERTLKPNTGRNDQ